MAKEMMKTINFDKHLNLFNRPLLNIQYHKELWNFDQSVEG